MSVYLWKNPEAPDKYICVYEYNNSPDRFQFLYGIRLAEKKIKSFPTFSVKVSKDKLSVFDCLPNNANCPLVDERIAAILKEMAPNDIEFFNTKIVCTDGVFLNYQLVNVTHAIECINREKSIYRKLVQADKADAIAGYMKPVYKPNCMEKHLLVRDKDVKSQLLVSQDIYERFHKEKIKNTGLITPHDFYKNVFPQYYQDE